MAEDKSQLENLCERHRKEYTTFVVGGCLKCWQENECDFWMEECVKSHQLGAIMAGLLTDEQNEELQRLRKEMDTSSLGDKPYSIAAHKLKRLIELEVLEGTADAEVGFCWVCRSTHILTAANCRAMDSIA